MKIHVEPTEGLFKYMMHIALNYVPDGRILDWALSMQYCDEVLFP